MYNHFGPFLAAIAALYLGSSLTDGLTDGATLGQSRVGQGRPHRNLMEPYGYFIGPHGAVMEPSWKVQTKPNHTKPNQILLKWA